ncbi:hypothetical protein ACSBR2_022078 [Camellia fascicularis]
MHREAELLSQKLARCWRQFLQLNKTTLDLAKAYNALNINDKCVKSMPFEKLALLIESPATRQTVKALLDLCGGIDHLLNRVASPNKKGTPTKSTHSKDVKRRGSIEEASKRSPVKLSRYQVRIVLCVYMILGHPVAVFSDQGEREIDLAKSAEKVLPKPVLYTKTLAFELVNDAESLEEDLVRAVCQLELSMIQTCKMTPDGDSGAVIHDMKAIQKQVTEDQKLLRERVHHLSGDAGIERMELALSDTYKGELKSNQRGNTIEGNQRASPVVRSLFRDDSLPPKEVGSSASSNNSDSQFQNSGEKSAMENELIVNEVLHEQHQTFAGSLNVTAEDQSSMKSKIKEAMKKAFWDGITDNMKQDEPRYD